MWGNFLHNTKAIEILEEKSKSVSLGIGANLLLFNFSHTQKKGTNVMTSLTRRKEKGECCSK